jgi:hypothetical protein
LESACTDEVNGLNKPISYVSGAMLRHFIQKSQIFLPFIHFTAHWGGLAYSSGVRLWAFMSVWAALLIFAHLYLK